VPGEVFATISRRFETGQELGEPPRTWQALVANLNGGRHAIRKESPPVIFFRPQRPYRPHRRPSWRRTASPQLPHSAYPTARQVRSSNTGPRGRARKWTAGEGLDAHRSAKNLAAKDRDRQSSSQSYNDGRRSFRRGHADWRRPSGTPMDTPPSWSSLGPAIRCFRRPCACAPRHHLEKPRNEDAFDTDRKMANRPPRQP